MKKFNPFNTDDSEPKHKESKGKVRESINFEDHFIDDYQHYPKKES